MDMTSLLISLISGAVGGNVAGAAMQDKSLGTLGNSLAGIFGGGIGSFILQALGLFVANGGLEQIVGNVAGGGVGGAVLLVIVSVLKSAMAKTA